MDGLSWYSGKTQNQLFWECSIHPTKYPLSIIWDWWLITSLIELAAHIFSLTTSDMTDIADEDEELYKDEDGHSLVSMQWLIDTYEDRLCQLVITRN